MLRARGAVAFAALLLAHSVITAEALTPEQRCTAAKLTAHAKRYGDMLKCYQRGIASGVADPACLEKANVKFLSRFAAADANGPCPGEAGVGAAEVDACVTTALTGLVTTATTSGRCQLSSFPNAGLTEEPGAGGCPSGMVRVDSFCVDVFEASLVVVHDDGSLSPWSPYLNPGNTRVRALSLRGAVPQGYVNGVQAAGACAEAGKRLCTDTEWLRACRGPAAATYPYGGGAPQPGVCNDSRTVHPAVEYYGTSDPWVFAEVGNPCLNQLPDSVDRTGANAGCVTAEGVLDMMGNLHEWTADPAGTFRGGYYVDATLNGPGCLYVTTAHDTSHADFGTGFRCCADGP